MDDGGGSESNGSESDVDRGELDDGGDSESNGSDDNVDRDQCDQVIYKDSDITKDQVFLLTAQYIMRHRISDK